MANGTDRYYEAPQSRYTSQFVPLPLDFMQGTIAKKQAAWDKQQALLDENLLDWDHVALQAKADIDYVQETKNKISEFLSQSEGKDIGSSEYGREYLRFLRDIKKDKNLQKIKSNYDTHQKYLARKEELRKKGGYADAPVWYKEYDRRYRDYIAEGGKGFEGEGLADPLIREGVNLRKEIEPIFNNMSAVDRDGIARAISLGHIDEKSRYGFQSIINSPAGRQLTEMWRQHRLDGNIKLEKGETEGDSHNKFVLDYLKNIGAERTFFDANRGGSYISPTQKEAHSKAAPLISTSVKSDKESTPKEKFIEAAELKKRVTEAEEDLKNTVGLTIEERKLRENELIGLKESRDNAIRNAEVAEVRVRKEVDKHLEGLNDGNDPRSPINISKNVNGAIKSFGDAGIVKINTPEESEAVKAAIISYLTNGTGNSSEYLKKEKEWMKASQEIATHAPKTFLTFLGGIDPSSAISSQLGIFDKEKGMYYQVVAADLLGHLRKEGFEERETTGAGEPLEQALGEIKNEKMIEAVQQLLMGFEGHAARELIVHQALDMPTSSERALPSFTLEGQSNLGDTDYLLSEDAKTKIQNNVAMERIVHSVTLPKSLISKRGKEVTAYNTVLEEEINNSPNDYIAEITEAISGEGFEIPEGALLEYELHNTTQDGDISEKGIKGKVKWTYSKDARDVAEAQEITLQDGEKEVYFRFKPTALSDIQTGLSNDFASTAQSMYISGRTEKANEAFEYAYNYSNPTQFKTIQNIGIGSTGIIHSAIPMPDTSIPLNIKWEIGHLEGTDDRPGGGYTIQARSEDGELITIGGKEVYQTIDNPQAVNTFIKEASVDLFNKRANISRK